MQLKFIIGFIFITVFLNAQVRIVKPIKAAPAKKTNLGIGVGPSRSVLYLGRNVKANNDATGLNATLVYGGHKLMRGSLEFTLYRPINIEPTWYNINSSSIEFNTHFIARMKEGKAVFYPIFGISYNIFSGFYTGVNDYMNLTRLYQKNQRVETRWWGLNVGTGFERYFKKVSVFVDYKMRVGVSEGNNQLSIQDVCFSGGLRFNLKAPTLNKIFRGTRSRYLLN
jgi:hypothetical protein